MGLSVVFHPLLVPTYMLLLLLLINPYLFVVSSPQDEGAKMLLLLVFLYTFFIHFETLLSPATLKALVKTITRIFMTTSSAVLEANNGFDTIR